MSRNIFHKLPHSFHRFTHSNILRKPRRYYNGGARRARRERKAMRQERQQQRRVASKEGEGQCWREEGMGAGELLKDSEDNVVA